MSRETRARVASLKQYTKALIAYEQGVLLQQKADASGTTATNGRITRSEMTGILLRVTERRLAESTRPQAPAQHSALSTVSSDDETRSSHLTSAVKALPRRAVEQLRNRNLIRDIKTGILSNSLARIATLTPTTTNIVMKSHLARINHEQVYGPSREVGGVAKFALEFVFGDIPSAIGAGLTGHRLGVGRPLDRVGRVIELIGAIPALTAPHRTRERTEHAVYKIAAHRAWDAADRAAHPGESGGERRARRRGNQQTVRG